MKQLTTPLILLVFCGLLAAETMPYQQQSRIDYIEKVLVAITSAQEKDIDNVNSYINVVDRNNCASNLSSLRTQCLIQYAMDNCKSLRSQKKKLNCELYSDIIVVNKLSEVVFIPRSERYQILKNNTGNSRQIIVNRLEQKYSRLVTQFSLTPEANCKGDDYQCLAQGLDKFCLDYTNQKSLSWQYCMSAIVWFIGTAR
ncbi:hypothetical protein [Pleionea sediminis]|uniref:hypothetical protein n=1 Tax=Pleionea sediminis TaxID=2569479 RepID=UPI00118497B7|nr:hypothetical protein [Pleionea sediminis]